MKVDALPLGRWRILLQYTNGCLILPFEMLNTCLLYCSCLDYLNALFTSQQRGDFLPPHRLEHYILYYTSIHIFSNFISVLS